MWKQVWMIMSLKPARAIHDFVIENLSNWYVRLCRRRFWKGDYTFDKISAYQTLYECLETIAKISAPIAPLYTDQLFKDLNAETRRDECFYIQATRPFQTKCR